MIQYNSTLFCSNFKFGLKKGSEQKTLRKNGHGSDQSESGRPNYKRLEIFLTFTGPNFFNALRFSSQLGNNRVNLKVTLLYV